MVVVAVLLLLLLMLLLLLLLLLWLLLATVPAPATAGQPHEAVQSRRDRGEAHGEGVDEALWPSRQLV